MFKYNIKTRINNLHGNKNTFNYINYYMRKIIQQIQQQLIKF